jgi:hypothetical protein
MTVYGPVCHPQKVVVYGLLFGPYNIYGVTDRSINFHFAQSDINYLLYYTQPNCHMALSAMHYLHINNEISLKGSGN